MAKLSLSGLGETSAALRALARSIPKLIAPALTKALAPTLASARDEAPKLSGGLAESLAIRGGTRREGAWAEVVTDEDYAAHVDLGTHAREADDFMQRAFDATASRAAKEAETLIRRAIH